MKKNKLLKIYPDTDPILRKECATMELPLKEEEKQLLFDMVEYLKNSQNEEFAEKNRIRSGVGLAAPQIGIAKRFFAIYYVNGDEQEVKYGLVNPKIIMSSARKCALTNGEGCLSVKEDVPGLVYRYFKITMRAYDVFQDKVIDITARGYDAIVLQHEYDHLYGILYYDKINKEDPMKQIENSVLI